MGIIRKKIKSAFEGNGIIRVIQHSAEILRMAPDALDKVFLAEYERVSQFKNKVDAENVIQLFYDTMTDGIISERIYHNVTCTAGRTQIAKALGNNTPTATYLDYCAVGTNNTAPAEADTTLNTELARKVITLLSQAGKQVTARTYFTTAEAIGALKEVGHFMDDATAAANSGTILDRSLMDVNKTASIALTILLTLDIDDA